MVVDPRLAFGSLSPTLPTAGRTLAGWAPVAALARRFARASEASAAVEFSFIGLTFTMLICVWLELGYTMILQVALDNATRDAARGVRTGTIASAAAFQGALCTDLSVLMSCSALQVNVVSGPSFTSLSTAVPTNAGQHMTTTGFSPGSPGQDVVVQVGYTRNLFLPIVDSVMGSNGALFVVSTLAFQNEPY